MSIIGINYKSKLISYEKIAKNWHPCIPFSIFQVLRYNYMWFHKAAQ